MILKKYKKHLFSIAVASALIGCGGGGSSSSDTTTSASGVVVDGYLDNATITLNGATTQTDANGAWSIPMSSFVTTENIISVTNGNDTASGGAFEGTMRSVYDADAVSNVTTPLTTLITSLVENNDITVDEATTTIANSLGLSEEILSQDPITLLQSSNDTEKTAAATALQQALIVQKLSEIIGNASSTDEDLKENVMSSVFDVVSSRLNTDTNTNFTTILNDVNTTIDTLKITYLEIADKLEAIKTTASYTVSEISNLDTNSFSTVNGLNTTEKNIESFTVQLETSAKEIAEADTAEEISTAKDSLSTLVSTISETIDTNTTAYIEDYSDNNFTTTDWTDETHTKNVDPNFDEVFVDTEVKRLDFVITPTRWQGMLDNMTTLYGEFGSTNMTTIGDFPTNGAIPIGIQIPEGVPTDMLDTNSTITTTDSDEDPIFVPTDLYYNGKQWYKIGARFKGNSSLESAWKAGILKLSFKLDFDEFENDYLDSNGDKMIKNQRFYGFKKFSLKNNYDDDSFLREKVAADVFRDAGVASSHTGFYNLYINHGNGSEYFGLYTLVEEVDGEVLDTQFSSDEGNLYKPEDEDGSQFIQGAFTESAFEKKTNEDDADWSDIEALFTALHDTTRTTDATTWRTNLESVFDVDTFLKYLAVNGVIQNWDTYGLMPHNYYLYNNPENGKLTWIPWDNNEALQDGKMGGSLTLDFSTLEANKWPLIEKIYADATYKAKYDTYVQDIIDNAFNTTTIQAKYDTYADLIKEYATSEVDGYTFLDTNSDNTSEFESAISTLKTHVEQRATAVATYLNQ